MITDHITTLELNNSNTHSKTFLSLTWPVGTSWVTSTLKVNISQTWWTKYIWKMEIRGQGPLGSCWSNLNTQAKHLWLIFTCLSLSSSVSKYLNMRFFFFFFSPSLQGLPYCVRPSKDFLHYAVFFYYHKLSSLHTLFDVFSSLWCFPFRKTCFYSQCQSPNAYIHVLLTPL